MHVFDRQLYSQHGDKRRNLRTTSRRWRTSGCFCLLYFCDPLDVVIFLYWLMHLDCFWSSLFLECVFASQVPVDGGQLQWSILLPALNGVVMTAISLLYANLISTTGTQLRNRQIRIQEALSAEIDGIRGLVQLLSYYPVPIKSLCGAHLMVYIKLLVSELGKYTDSFALRSSVPPLTSYRDNLHKGSMQDAIHGNILERSYEMLDRVATGRSSRITALQNTFPPLHNVTISILTVAILFVFLIETDRPVILFLDNFQLRLIWSLLVGTLTAIFCIGIDLNNPFVGTYTIPADQLLDESEDLLSLIQDATQTRPFEAPSQQQQQQEKGKEQARPFQSQPLPQPIASNPLVSSQVMGEVRENEIATDSVRSYFAGYSGEVGTTIARPAVDATQEVYSNDQPNKVSTDSNGEEQATSFEDYMRQRSDMSMG